ncbi:MAG: LURP-one-related family protein [Ilumatobacteraceae bacterium]
MGLLRHHRGHDGNTHYQMRQELLTIGDDFWIEDDSGNRVYRVDGKAVRARDTWIMEDADRNEVAHIQEKKLTIRDSITIEVDGGKAHVKKALVGIRDRFHIEVDGGEDLKAHGNVVDHEYEIERSGDTVGEVSKRWFRARDTYGVEVRTGVDPVLILAITVAIDALAR